MGVYIKGMEMPKRCGECPLSLFPHSPCWENGGVVDWENRPNWCPLVEIPPHGRLIDADAFLAEQRHLYCENCGRRKGMKNGKMKFVYDIGDAPCRACGYGDVLDDIDDAPTIIESTIDQLNSDSAVNEAEGRQQDN